MRLGCSLRWVEDLPGFLQTARTAVAEGFEVIGVPDSPVAWRDTFVCLTLLAQELKDVTIGTMVTSPFIRHPVVNAGAMSALYDLTDGRVMFGIGRGGTIVADIGREAASQQDMRDYLTAMRDLFQGKAITWEGAEVRPMGIVRKTPVYYAAVGPKALRMAGELADGVVIFTGPSIPDIKEKIDLVRQGAVAAGRDQSAVDLWVTCHCSIDDSPQVSKADGPRFVERDDHHARLSPELKAGFKDNAFAGTSAEFREFMQALDACGVSCFIVLLSVAADPPAMLRQIGSAFHGH